MLGHVLRERSDNSADHLCRIAERYPLRDISRLSLSCPLSHRPRNIEQQKLFREAALRRALVASHLESVYLVRDDLRT